MTAIARIRTLRGLAPNEDQLTDDDIVEVDGEAPLSTLRPRGPITVPPPSGKRYLRTTRYSLVAARATKPTTLRLVADH